MGWGTSQNNYRECKNEDYGSLMGFLTPTLHERVMDASLSIPEHVMKELQERDVFAPRAHRPCRGADLS